LLCARGHHAETGNSLPRKRLPQCWKHRII
jgi:hypothetical protein